MTSRLDVNTAARAIPTTALVVGLAVRLMVLVVLAGAAAGCTPRTRRTPDDTLVVLIPDPAKTADPRSAISAHDTKLSRLVCPGLFVMDTPDLEPTFGLAESIDGLDDLTWDIRLRADARFSDGQPVTADDVVWTYQTAMAEGSKTFAERFAAIERLDDRRVRFRLKKKLVTLRTDLDFGIVARHAADAKGKFPGGRAVCAGPYQVDRITSNRILLSANPHYYGGPPGIAHIDLKVVRDAAARIVMLAGGSADLVQNAIRPDLVDDVLARARLRELRGASNVLSYVVFNLRDPVMKDVRVRRAISLAIDRRALIARKFSDRAVISTGLLQPGHWAYPVGAPVFERDLAAAGALLDAAGYPDPDGPGGRPRLTIVHKTSSDQFRLAIVRVIAAQLSQLDIAVEVRPFEFGTFLADLKKGAFQMATLQFSDVTEPDMYFAFFHSSRIPDVGHQDDLNRGHYINPDVDRLTEAGRAELDRARRITIYTELQRIIAADLPIVPLWHEDNVAIVNRDVDGYALLPNARWSFFARVHKKR